MLQYGLIEYVRHQETYKTTAKGLDFLSICAAGLTRSKLRATSNESDPKQILKIRLAKGEITKEAFLDLQRLISEKD